MDLQAEIAKIKDIILKAQHILIATHEHPTFDSIGSSLALYLGLVSLGKRVSLVCPDEMTVGLSSFIGVDKIKKEFGRKNLVISLDYQEGSVDKVSYHIEGDKFNLVIEPKDNFPPFNPEKVHYQYGDTNVDLIFTIDTIHLGGLKKIYESNKGLFAGKQLINVDRHPNNSRYGTANLIDPVSVATAEIVAYILADLGVQLSADIATNLLNAVYSATNSFQVPEMTATAFELAGSCIRAGAECFYLETNKPKTTPVSASAPVEPTLTPAPSTPPVQAPDDWLKPKIFKSSGNLL